ncbi:MAG: NUDIX domain-containing protein [Candidatus Nanohaloarchaea archaeon]|nr:NUDIX domain-containing protein [Candidatus Nanohaloarchaea archaeon]
MPEAEPDAFDPSELEHPSVTVDVIIFTVKDDDLKVLLVERDHDPFEGYWALPGGFIDMEESLETAAERVLEDKTGVTDVYLEQLYTFGDPDRDPRTRVITVGYFALVHADAVEIGEEERAAWHSAYDLPELAFDHADILEYAVKRLRWKLEYTTAVFSLLPDRFTMSDLQHAYEIVFDREFDKRNFRKKIKKLDLVEYTGEKTEGVSHRPAKLYRPNRDVGEIVEIL